MNPPDDIGPGFESFSDAPEAEPVKKVNAEALMVDLRAGMRTKGFLEKYGLSLSEFEDLIKQLIRKNLLSKEEFKAWKNRRPLEPPAAAREPGRPQRPPQPTRPPQPAVADASGSTTQKVNGNVTTYVINDPERNNSWSLQLFSIKRDSIKGAKFKVNLHGKKYAFVVEQLLFRGQVAMLGAAAPKKSVSKDKRADAIKYISQYGWSAYLENRAYEANLGSGGPAAAQKARLVLLLCRNNTFLAALHTPAPAVNLYVGSSLESIMGRLGKAVDTSELKF
jgi:hypothetical protein